MQQKQSFSPQTYCIHIIPWHEMLGIAAHFLYRRKKKYFMEE